MKIIFYESKVTNIVKLYIIHAKTCKNLSLMTAFYIAPLPVK